VGEQSFGPGEIVDHVPRRDDLLVGEKPPRRIIEWRSAQERDLGVAVVVDFLDVVKELKACQPRCGLILDLRIPVLSREVVQAEEFLVVEIIADEVGLDIEHKLPGQALGSRLN
jgi:hypothetical protein